MVWISTQKGRSLRRKELMFSMYSFHQKETQIIEPFPCPECGKIEMVQVVENCKLHEGTIVRRLQHYKCSACGARFFDDDAMHRIQEIRNKKMLAHAI